MSMMLCDAGAAAVPAASEYEVKAAFLFQFSRFVEWPPESFASPDAPLTICVIGSNPFGSTLQEISQGESVQTHALAVKAIARVEDLDACHIVFIGSAGGAATAQVLAYLAGKRVLTVGDGSEFTQQGGVIGFVTVNGKVRLHVNRSSAETAQLRISAKLLRVAEQTG
jgi:YfiR/HmsC-like